MSAKHIASLRMYNNPIDKIVYVYQYKEGITVQDAPKKFENEKTKRFLIQLREDSIVKDGYITINDKKLHLILRILTVLKKCLKCRTYNIMKHLICVSSISNDIKTLSIYPSPKGLTGMYPEDAKFIKLFIGKDNYIYRSSWAKKYIEIDKENNFR